MHLLFFSPTIPIPANNGYKMRIWALLRALASEGHEIDLISFADPADRNWDREQLLKVCRAVSVIPKELAPLSASADYRGRLRALASRIPYSVLQYQSSEMKARLAAELKNGSFEAVFCATPYPLANLPEAISVPLIVDDQNVEYLLVRRYVACERNPVKRAYAWLECRKLREWERYACSRADMVMVCSEYDHSVLKTLSPRTSFAVVPNIIDLDRYEPAQVSHTPTLLYLGGMDYYPNRDAVAFFVSQILPELRILVPGVRFVIAYSASHAPSEQFRARFMAHPDVEFIESADLRVEIAEAAVFVVPIRIGSGTRFKILEAAAMGKPIVSTRIGAEGLDFADGECIVLADQPHMFANAVAELLRNPSRMCQLGLAGRRTVEQRYSFQVLRSTLRGAMDELREKCGKAGIAHT